MFELKPFVKVFSFAAILVYSKIHKNHLCFPLSKRIPSAMPPKGKLALSKGKNALAKSKAAKAKALAKSKTKAKGKAMKAAKAFPKGKAKRKQIESSEDEKEKENSLPKRKKGKKSLTKKKLEKLGKMSLREKVEKVVEESETLEEAAVVLKENLDKGEHSRIWSRHQTHLKKNPEEAKAQEDLGKKEKGLASVLWFVTTQNNKFLSVKTSHTAEETLTKGEVWESELQMGKRFSDLEFQAHLQSGRIKWRNDPWTAGVFNYCDQGDQRKEVKVKKATKYEAGQEYEANEEEEAKFVKFLGKGGSQLLLEAEKSFASSSKGKPALTKGVGKSGAKGKLAIKDGRTEEEEPEEKSEAAQMADAIRKTQRCKEQLVVGISNMEEAILAATTNGRLTTKCKKEHEMLVKDCSVWLEKLKSLISKKAEGKTLEEVKELLAKAAAKVKEVKDEAKELQQTANKAVSKATTKAKK